jgi:CubicO group peptidase (beta-lactamase class C family)
MVFITICLLFQKENQMNPVTSFIKRFPRAVFWGIALGGARPPKSEAISSRSSSFRWITLHPPGGYGTSLSARRSFSAIEKQRAGAIMSWKTCIRTVILGLALLAVAGCGQIGLGATPRPTLQQEMEAFVQAHLANGKFAGAVLVARGDKVLFQGGYGMANQELDVPNTPETVFRLGSLTKQFTAAAILQLQDQGLLDINDTVDRYLPGYPNGDEITIYQLLNHTSGIPDYEYLESTLTYRNAVSLDALMAKFSGLPFDFTPGSQFKYSSSGYVILTAIIEKVSGQSYADYLAEHIFQPLGMEATRYDNADTVLPGRAAGYTWDGDAYHIAEFFDMSNVAGAGGLVSTVGNMYKWDRALYTDALLSPAAREAFFTPTVSTGDGLSYAYGWFIRETPEHTQALHSGGINGFVTFVIRDAATQLYVVVLSNVEHGAAEDVAQGLMAIAYGEPYDIPGQIPVVEVDPAVLQKYAGNYQVSADLKFTITAEASHLFGQSPGGPKFEIFPTSETDFFAKIADLKLHFEVGADGAVTELVIHDGSKEYHATKLD